MHTVGIRCESDMYSLSFSLEATSALLMLVALIHTKSGEGSLVPLQSTVPLREVLLSSTGYRMNYHVGLTIGLLSTLWAFHLIYVAVRSVSGDTTNAYSLIFRRLCLGKLGWV